MSRLFSVGDIHGAHLALSQCLERSGFDKENDTLIPLGDICDGWEYVYECVEELRKIKTIDIMGNHDDWFRRWLTTTVHPEKWTEGGDGTVLSYARHAGVQPHLLNPGDIPADHWKYFMHMVPYYVDTERNVLFVHGGFNPLLSVKEDYRNHPYNLHWNRSLWREALKYKEHETMPTVDGFKEIFIGHTNTLKLGGLPMRRGGVCNLDTGAGWYGKLTIMDVDTHEYWQSDPVQSLYRSEGGRKKV